MHTNIWIAGDADYEQKKYEKTLKIWVISWFLCSEWYIIACKCVWKLSK